jgi:hypothetical protein
MQRLAKPNAIVLFHIPLPEAYNDADIDESTNKPLNFGKQLDGKGASGTNGHFFEKGIQKAFESEDEQGSKVLEVKVIGTGHSHASDYCRRVSGVWMCFGGGG